MAGILRAAGLKVEVHDDHLPQNATDPEWLTLAGKNGWIVVTRDERIRYRVAEKQAIRRAKVRAFVIVAHGDLRIEEIAEILLKALSKIQSIAAQEKPPFIAKDKQGCDPLSDRVSISGVNFPDLSDGGFCTLWSMRELLPRDRRAHGVRSTL